MVPWAELWLWLWCRAAGMSCCIKGNISGVDGCPVPAQGMVSGAKTAGTYACTRGGGGGGGHRPAPSTAVPLFDETELEVRIMPDRSVADFFVAGGRWAGTMAWPLSTPRAPDDSQVSVWSSAAGIKVDIDAWSMGCGWLDPSWTDSPSL